MEEGFALKESLWHTLADKEHRMQHWILKLTIANSANLPKCRRWNSEWLLLRTDSRIALAHHAASRTSVHYRHLNRCSRFQHPALNQKARPKDRKAKEKARTRVARHSLQIHLRFKASGTSRPCTKSVGQLGNSSQKTRVGNFNPTSVRTQVVHANMFA